MMMTMTMITGLLPVRLLVQSLHLKLQAAQAVKRLQEASEREG